MQSLWARRIGENRAGGAVPERLGGRLPLLCGCIAGFYDARWREARAIFLKQHPLCAFCQAEGKIVPATVVDHIIPHRGDQRLFWDQTNWESLFKECHDKKTGSGL